MLTRCSQGYDILQYNTHIGLESGHDQIVEGSKAWRDAWRDILGTQQRLISTFEGLYAPILGASEDYQGHVPEVTPADTMSRTTRLTGILEELRTDLLEEINNVESRLIKPADEARGHLQPLRKTIKKRGDRKVGTST